MLLATRSAVNWPHRSQVSVRFSALDSTLRLEGFNELDEAFERVSGFAEGRPGQVVQK